MSAGFLTLMAMYEQSAQDRLNEWKAAIRASGFTGKETPGLLPHISLATFAPEDQDEAAALTRLIAAEYAPVEVHISHIGLFAGGKVLFAAPDVNKRLYTLKHAFGDAPLNGHVWTPHTTLLMDEPENVLKALPIVTRHFIPFFATLTKLSLCAFWPMQEIVTVALTGDGVKKP